MNSNLTELRYRRDRTYRQAEALVKAACRPHLRDLTDAESARFHLLMADLDRIDHLIEAAAVTPRGAIRTLIAKRNRRT